MTGRQTLIEKSLQSIAECEAELAELAKREADYWSRNRQHYTPPTRDKRESAESYLNKISHWKSRLGCIEANLNDIAELQAKWRAVLQHRQEKHLRLVSLVRANGQRKKAKVNPYDRVIAIDTGPGQTVNNDPRARTLPTRGAEWTDMGPGLEGALKRNEE